MPRYHRRGVEGAMGERSRDAARRYAAFAATLLLALGAAGASAQTKDITVEGMRSEKRVALVIGNAGYAVGRLNNPVLDARAMAQALRGLGFDVQSHENLDYRGMQRAIADFGGRIAGGGVGLFYYSGHGVQLDGRNYLVPVDAELKAERYVRGETLDVDGVLAQMQEAKTRLNVVILDACRNNPFAQRFRSVARGLAPMSAPEGTYIAYAATAGTVADDGEPGKNGVYTSELLAALRAPGLKIEDVFKRVRAGVLNRTGRRQEPEETSKLLGDFYFNLPTMSMAPPPPPRFQGREEMRQEFGTLALSARLPGVEVWVGDHRVWTSRAGAAYVLSNVPAGTHRVVAKKDGHKEWTREVVVAANQRAELVIDIEPLRPEPAKVLTTEDGAEMVLVPAGEFLMGSNEFTDDERPPHRVYLDAFHIDKYEVTNALYRRFVQATSWALPVHWNDPKFNGSTQPVVGVSWHAAAAYCGWAGKRLPTEAEWEKAARGTDGRKYPWGEAWDAGRANSFESRLGRTTPVGSYPSGASPYGVHDMAGNVFEWVADRYAWDYYQRSPERNPQGPDSGQSRVVRGGSWNDYPFDLRAPRRNGGVTPVLRDLNVGFRCARGLS